jgi:hypothetical protein
MVQAEDANNLVVSSYQGTVHFSLGVPDAAATLPADYTFTFRDQGRHVFLVTLEAAGSQSVTVTDTSTSSITGSAPVIVAAAPAATRFVVQMPAQVPAGEPVNVTVEAENAAGFRAWNYTGAVSITSSAGNALLLSNYQFTSHDAGKHTFQIVLNTAGPQIVTVTDNANSSVKGSAATKAIAAPAATHFVLYGLYNNVVGQPGNVTIVAVDAAGRRDWSYSGTVQFSSTDPKAALPLATTFSPTQHGWLNVPVVFNTSGTQTLTVTAVNNNLLTGKKTVTVAALGPATHFAIYAQPSVSHGSTVYVYVVALDANNRIVPSYNGTVQFSSSDSAATLPPQYTFSAADKGRHVFPVVFGSTGTDTLTVTDSAHSLSVSVSVSVS